MPNVTVNKVVLGSETLLDLTADTVTPSTLMLGYTAHDASGAAIVGTATGGDEGSAYQDEDGYIVLGDGESSAPQGNVSITQNGTYDVADYAGATVDVIKTYTATISGSGHYSNCNVKKNGTGTAYYTNGDTFTFTDDDDLSIRYASASNSYKAYLMVNGVVAGSTGMGIKTYTVSKPRADVAIELAYSTTSDVTVNIIASVVTVTSNGFSPVGGHVFAEVDVPGMSETDLSNYIQRNTTFTNIDWPDGMTKIGSYAFAECRFFKSSSLPSGITRIENYAFYSCSRLNLTGLPSGITYIGSYAFYSCINLALTSLPSGLTSINDNAFRGCERLALTELPSNVTSIGNSAFMGCHSLTLTSLPSGLVTIGSNVFQYCTSLTSITCEGAITVLGSYTFNGSSTYPMALTSASFPNMALTSNIGQVFGSATAASACQQLAFCDIGSTVGIGANAFANCYALETLVLRKTDAVCTLSNVSAFLNTPMRGYNSLTGTVYVPSALISSYQTATNWSTLYGDGTVTFEAIEGSEYERD